MTLPRLLLLTDRRRMKPGFEIALLAALQGGVRWLQLREKDLAPREIVDLAARAQKLTEKFGAQLFLNGRADLARVCHADGLHLPENEISTAMARLTLGFHAPVGVSVHSLESAQRAAHEGADYLMFGPVFETNSHPETAPTGLKALREVAAHSEIPVLAVGGVTARRAKECLEAGAWGVAVIGAVWGAADVSAATRDLVAAVS